MESLSPWALLQAYAQFSVLITWLFVIPCSLTLWVRRLHSILDKGHVLFLKNTVGGTESKPDMFLGSVAVQQQTPPPLQKSLMGSSYIIPVFLKSEKVLCL